MQAYVAKRYPGYKLEYSGASSFMLSMLYKNKHAKPEFSEPVE